MTAEGGGRVFGSQPWLVMFNDEPILALATLVVYHAPPTVCSESILGQKVMLLFALISSIVPKQWADDEVALHASK